MAASLAPGKELGNPFPLLRCHKNIYVLPGVPGLLVHQFGLMKSALIQGVGMSNMMSVYHRKVRLFLGCLTMQQMRLG